MCGRATESTEAAPLVAKHIDAHLLAEQVGDQGTYREEEMDDAESGAKSSDLSKLESETEEEQWEGEDKGRPNYKRAAAGAGQLQSTQEFFRRGNGHDNDNFFATAGKHSMRGVLVRSLSVAASSPQQLGSALTPNSGSDSSEGAGREGGQELNRVGSKEVGGREEANLVWAKEVASMSEDEMEDMVCPEGSATPTPMPARWAIPTPVPVTPSNGNKKRVLAAGTSKSTRVLPPPRRLAGIPAHGWSNGARLAEMLAAIVLPEKRIEAREVGMEKRMEERAAEREEKAEERERWAGVREKMGREREARLTERVEAMGKKLAEGLTALSRDMGTKAQWDQAQWESLGREMERCRKEIAEVGRQTKLAAVVVAIETPALPLQRKQEQRRQPAEPRWEERRADTLALSTQQAVAERQQKALPPAEMEGVVMTKIEVEEMEEFSDMEGVEREGLFALQYAPELDAPATSPAPAPEGQKKKKGEGKGKEKEVGARKARQQARQAVVDRAAAEGAEKRVLPVTPAVPRTILKRPETVAVEKDVGEKKEAAKLAAMEKWK